jgi:hypothetical protein
MNTAPIMPRPTRIKWGAEKKESKRMPKLKIAALAAALNEAGDVDAELVRKHFAATAEQVREGHYKLEDFTVTETEIEPGRVRVEVIFDRVETDVETKAEEAAAA